MSKFVNLEQIKVLANKVKSEDAALGTKLETVTTKVDNLVAAGGEANILEGVKVNGAALAISDKMVDILIASGEENGTISVNGAAVAIKGLAALAYKSEITEDELGEALKASIAAKATKADLDALPSVWATSRRPVIRPPSRSRPLSLPPATLISRSLRPTPPLRASRLRPTSCTCT